MLSILPVFSISSIIADLFRLASFLITGFAFYKVASIRFLPNPWMAFLPIFNLYMTGSLADSMKYRFPKINRVIGDLPLAVLLPATWVFSQLIIARLFLPLAVLISFACWAVEIMVYYFIFSLYGKPSMAIPFTVLSIFPLVGPCLILYCLKDRRI